MSLNHKRSKILIVDDQKENVLILIEALGDEFAVIAARSGEKAIALAIAVPHPDLIILDVVMPGMDGYEVCRRLKANPLTCNIPVLFVTSLSDDDDEKRGLELGAVDYIIKPIRPELVKTRVRSQINLIQHQLQLLALNEHLEKRINEEVAKNREKDIILLHADKMSSIGQLACGFRTKSATDSD